jgi:phosphatidylglycerophosphate synthase
MNLTTPYSYSRSVKSNRSDELINVYLIRPLAGVLVRALYPTPVSPNQVTIAAIVVGLASASLYAMGATSTTIAAGLLLFAKDVCDAADGQLARVREQYSRKGRFLDSIGDFIVSLAVLLSIGWTISAREGSLVSLFLSLLAFVSLVLRVSYHVFYHTSFLHLRKAYATNRTTEEIRAEDLAQDITTRRLQRIFLFLYGWQDTLMVRMDRWSKRGLKGQDEPWYADRVAVRWSGFLGLGTENFVLAVFSVFNVLPLYLLTNTVVLNLNWGLCVAYRRKLARRLGRKGADSNGGPSPHDASA